MLLMAGIMTIVILSGCKVKKDLTGSPETGLAMKYSNKDGQALLYDWDTELNEKVSFQGNDIEIGITVDLIFSMEPALKTKGKLDYKVTIDEMETKIASPRGESSGDVSGATGKSFNLCIDPDGRNPVITGADNVKYELIPGQSRSVAMNYQNFFPKLPHELVKQGDSWKYSDTINESENDSKVILIFNNHQTFDGTDTIEGMECARIVNRFSGTIEGQGIQEGINLVTRGTLEGSETWYFSWEKGILVKQSTIGTAEAMVTSPDKADIQIPTQREFTYELVLKK